MIIFSLPHSGETDKIVNCNNNIECYPSGVSNLVSSSLIMCKNNGCVCNECFTKNITTGQCTYTVPSPTYCYYYEEEDDECVDNRKSQLAAFVLSLTLSGFGVANFYIGQNVLGTTQLLLFLGLLIVTCCVCSSLCIVYGCMDCQASYISYVSIISIINVGYLCWYFLLHCGNIVYCTYAYCDMGLVDC